MHKNWNYSKNGVTYFCKIRHFQHKIDMCLNTSHVNLPFLFIFGIFVISI